METPVKGIFVFRLTLGAHLENLHSGQRAVIGDVFYDGEAGPAVGTVGKGVAVTAVINIAEIVAAFGAGGQIRRDELVLVGAGGACSDLKTIIATRLFFFRFELCDMSLRGVVFLELFLKGNQGVSCPLNLYLHASRSV